MKKSLCLALALCFAMGIAGMSFANTTIVVSAPGPTINPPVSELLPIIPPPPPPPKK